jgi:hypothetical protein
MRARAIQWVRGITLIGASGWQNRTGSPSAEENPAPWYTDAFSVPGVTLNEPWTTETVPSAPVNDQLNVQNCGEDAAAG